MSREHPTRAELHGGSFQMPPAGVTTELIWVNVSDLEELGAEDDALPRRGYAMRPDWTGAQILHEDGQPLGRVIRVESSKDYTSASPTEHTRVQYEPTRPASA